MFKTAVGWVKLYKSWKPRTGRSSLPPSPKAPMQSLFVALDAVIGGLRFPDAAQATRIQPNTTIAVGYTEGARDGPDDQRAAQDSGAHKTPRETMSAPRFLHEIKSTDTKVADSCRCLVSPRNARPRVSAAWFLIPGSE